MHAHLDSTRLGLPFRPHTAGPGLAGLVQNDRDHWRSASGRSAERATFTLGATVASGVTRVRSHAQVDTDCGLERLEGVLEAREAHAGRVDVQVVAFPQSGILRDPGTADLLAAAVEAGADLVGGIDPCAFDRDPVRHLDAVFGLAERVGRGIDLHLHEAGELGAFTTELICERVAAHGMQGRVTISHAFALSTVDPARRARPSSRSSRAHDVAVTTVAPGTTPPLPTRTCGPQASGSAWGRTGSATTGRPTATATCSAGPGSSRSGPGCGPTRRSRAASRWHRSAVPPSPASVCPAGASRSAPRRTSSSSRPTP